MMCDSYPQTGSEYDDEDVRRKGEREEEEGDGEDVWGSMETVGEPTRSGNH